MLQSPTCDFNMQANVGKGNRALKDGRMGVKNVSENSGQLGKEFNKGFCQCILV